jgi:hypothetical protein
MILRKKSRIENLPPTSNLQHLASSTNKTDRHDLTEILLKVALSTITIYAILVVIPCHYKCSQALWILMDVALLLLVAKKPPKQFKFQGSKM